MLIPRSEHSNIEKVCGFDDDLSRPLAPRFDKTAVWANTNTNSKQYPWMCPFSRRKTAPKQWIAQCKACIPLQPDLARAVMHKSYEGKKKKERKSGPKPWLVAVPARVIHLFGKGLTQGYSTDRGSSSWAPGFELVLSSYFEMFFILLVYILCANKTTL